MTHIPNDPQGCSWENSDNQLEIKWMSRSPAPDEVLEFTTCACKRTHCATNQCQCFLLNLKCMDLCGCRSCSNKNEFENEEIDDEDTKLDYDDEDDDDDD